MNTYHLDNTDAERILQNVLKACNMSPSKKCIKTIEDDIKNKVNERGQDNGRNKQSCSF